MGPQQFLNRNMTFLPQLSLLPSLTNELLELDFVTEVFLSGGLGRGQGDKHSDIDLQVGVTKSVTDFLDDAILNTVVGTPPLALKRIPLGSGQWLHHMILVDGTMVDLVCRTDINFSETQHWIRLTGSETQQISLPEPVPAESWFPQTTSTLAVADVVEMFWTTIHKHRRGLVRNQTLAIWTGIRYSICDLLRLQFIAATGRDPGSLMNMGIYGLSGANRWLDAHATWDWQSVLAWSQEPDWCKTVSFLADAGGIVCRDLTQTWSLPTRLTVLAKRVQADWHQAITEAEARLRSPSIATPKSIQATRLL